jgi:hypothetical protein
LSVRIADKEMLFANEYTRISFNKMGFEDHNRVIGFIAYN